MSLNYFILSNGFHWYTLMNMFILKTPNHIMKNMTPRSILTYCLNEKLEIYV